MIIGLRRENTILDKGYFASQNGFTEKVQSGADIFQRYGTQKHDSYGAVISSIENMAAPKDSEHADF